MYTGTPPVGPKPTYFLIIPLSQGIVANKSVLNETEIPRLGGMTAHERSRLLYVSAAEGSALLHPGTHG